MKDIPAIIAIDGPAASGKSTIGKILADELGYLFFDTGVMYRAVTWAALQQRLSMEDKIALTRLAQTIEIDVRVSSKNDGRSCDVVVDGQDVSLDIRSSEIEKHVSMVSAVQGVRQALSIQQRKIGLRGKVVMVGRDIGTIVLPEADCKIYLEASVIVRAERRYSELLTRGQESDYHEILSSIQQRDQTDSTRSIAPLKPALDAIIIDTDTLSSSEVLVKIKDLWSSGN